MSAFFRFLLFAVFVYLAYILFKDIFFPPSKQKKRQEGKTTIKDRERRSKKIDKDEGEYVDYEEVDDE